MELEEALDVAFAKLGIIVPRNNKNITKDDVILALCIDESRLPELLGYSASGDGGFKHFRSRLFPHKSRTTKSYVRYLLFNCDLQRCYNCLSIKSLSEFSIDTKDIYGIRGICKKCDATRPKDRDKQNLCSRKHYINNKAHYLERNARRRTKLKVSCPKWADREEIREFYRKCPIGYHVDHIIPLNNPRVSGLHVLANLQYLKAADNLKKSNTFNLE